MEFAKGAVKDLEKKGELTTPKSSSPSVLSLMPEEGEYNEDEGPSKLIGLVQATIGSNQCKQCQISVLHGNCQGFSMGTLPLAGGKECDYYKGSSQNVTHKTGHTQYVMVLEMCKGSVLMAFKECI